MTIIVQITIQAIDPKDNAKGCGVAVISNVPGFAAETTVSLPACEVMCMEGLAAAINGYMHANGDPRFDTMRPAVPNTGEVH